MILETDTHEESASAEPVSYETELQAFIAAEVAKSGGKAELHEIVDLCCKEFFGQVRVTDVVEAAKVVQDGWSAKRAAKEAVKAEGKAE
jgi:hypothetical protein